MYINKREVERQVEKFSESKNIWTLADGELYNLCEKYPDHKNTEQVIAKLWFIGRTYAATLERRRNAKATTDELYENVAKTMCGFLDERLGVIKGKTDAFAEMLELHNDLAKSFIIESETKNAAIKRSLASKYLHFHCRDKFYIYDSNAESAISKLVSKRKKSNWEEIDIGEYESKVPENVDNVYCNFCLRAVALHKYLNNKNLTVKQLDNFLLFVQKNYSAKK